MDTGASVPLVYYVAYQAMPATSQPKLIKLSDSFRLEVADDGQIKVEGMTTINFEIKGQFYEWDMYVVHM